MSKLYIPKRIKVGYQERSDTYTKKLAYVIYFDDAGKLRKETSWEGWRDKKIPAEEFDNVPTSGFCLNKNIQRYNWNHFGSGRSMIRVYDPRGIEFEVTTENLIAILTHSDCLKRGLSGEYVYAWSGKELVLLPTSCEEYQAANDFTKLQAMKISAKELVAGAAYKTKKDKIVIYVGRFPWYEYKSKKKSEEEKEKERNSYYYHRENILVRESKMEHIFTDEKVTYFFPSGASFLAAKVSDVVSNYNEIIDSLKKDVHSSKIVSAEVFPRAITAPADVTNYWWRDTVFSKFNGKIYQIRCDACNNYNRHTGKYDVTHYNMKSSSHIDLATFSINASYNSDGAIYFNNQEIGKPAPIEIGDLYVTLDNGNKVKVDDISNLSYTY